MTDIVDYYHSQIISLLIKTYHCIITLFLSTVITAADIPVAENYESLTAQAIAGKQFAVRTIAEKAPRMDSDDAQQILEIIKKSKSRLCSALAVYFIDHPDIAIEAGALSTIGSLGLDRISTIDILLKKLVDPSPVIQQAAASALLSIQDPHAWAPLISLLDRDDQKLAHTAYGIVHVLTGREFSPEREIWEEWYADQVIQEQKLFTQYQHDVMGAPPNKIIAVIDSISLLRLIREDALIFLHDLEKNADAGVTSRVIRCYQQWTGANTHAAATEYYRRDLSMSLSPHIQTAPIDYPALIKSFIKLYGVWIVLMLMLGSSLGALIWFFRTPSGKKLTETTKHYLHIPGTKVFVVMTKEEKKASERMTAAVSKSSASQALVAAQRPASASSSPQPALEKKISDRLTAVFTKKKEEPTETPEDQAAIEKRISQRMTSIITKNNAHKAEASGRQQALEKKISQRMTSAITKNDAKKSTTSNRFPMA